MLPIGTKVIVLDKTVGKLKENSLHYNKSQAQGYAYVVGHDSNSYRKEYIISFEMNDRRSGDFFRDSDVVAYGDPLSSAQEL